MNKNFLPSKILLFGEYLVLYGGSAVAMPYPKFGGQLTYKATADTRWKPLLEYFKKVNADLNHELDLKRISEDIQNGLTFESTIKVGYGIGSSGALIAAVYQKYGQIKDAFNLGDVKHDLSILESFFHGNSSGLDPLVSFLKQPIIYQNQNATILENIPHIEFTLLDSGVERSSKQGIAMFDQLISLNPSNKSLFDKMLVINESIVTQIISGKINNASVREFCDVQQRLMKPFFLNNYLKPGIKLCGAGFGGYFLQF